MSYEDSFPADIAFCRPYLSSEERVRLKKRKVAAIDRDLLHVPFSEEEVALFDTLLADGGGKVTQALLAKISRLAIGRRKNCAHNIHTKASAW